MVEVVVGLHLIQVEVAMPVTVVAAVTVRDLTLLREVQAIVVRPVGVAIAVIVLVFHLDHLYDLVHSLDPIKEVNVEEGEGIEREVEVVQVNHLVPALEVDTVVGHQTQLILLLHLLVAKKTLKINEKKRENPNPNQNQM